MNWSNPVVASASRWEYRLRVQGHLVFYKSAVRQFRVREYVDVLSFTRLIFY